MSEPSSLDHALTAQFIVAWAGETGEDGRLRWWKSDLVSEFGGEDLFKRLLPNTWDWAVLQGAREAARRHDAAGRGRDHQPDRLMTLFSLGFEIDERIDERLHELKRSGRAVSEALPGLVEIVGENWQPKLFAQWVEAHGKPGAATVPSGRRLKGAPPESVRDVVDALLANLAPLGDDYPLPHFVRSV
jgi:hypothetical protein